jgi:general secretion pathway protein A
MYLSYFGLNERPFSSTPDRRFVFLSERHKEGLAHLLYGLTEQGGFVQLTGEVGTGKTTLCRYALEHLPSEVDVALILNPIMTATELLATMCDELGVAYPTDTASLKPLVDALHRHLLDAHARGRRTVLIVDEAQHLNADVLEQMRLLTNLETGKAKLLQIILIGQPELIELLSKRELRQIAQRVSARYHLLPLSKRETGAYVLHRLQVAGQPEGIFERAALREVYRLSRGVPRVINLICDRGLLGAYATRRERVTVALVRRAAREVFGEAKHAPAQQRRWDWRWTSIAALVVVTTAGASLLAWGFRRPTERESRAAAAIAGAEAPRRDEGGASVQPVRETADVARLSLASVLADSALTSDKASAFQTLYARWGLDDPRARRVSCETDLRPSAGCLARRGTWKMVRRLNLPAVIELVTPSGARHYATVSAVGPSDATLVFGQRTMTFPLTEIEGFWDGAFTVLWRPPRPMTVPIGPGSRGQDIAWLRQRLAEIDGTSVATPAAEGYDDDLRARVIAFQRKQSLLPDGVAGEETLARLTAILDPKAPSLSAESKS